jgi:hypothetical protein
MDINQNLVELNSEVDQDESRFLQLAIERDDFIQSHLHSLQGQLKTDFVNAELKVNRALVAYAEESLKASLKQLSGLVRGRKVLKKYK